MTTTADQLPLFGSKLIHDPPAPRRRTSFAPPPPSAAFAPVDAAASTAIRTALAPYLDLDHLAALAARGEDVRQALRDLAPREAEQIVSVLAALLRPPAERLQVSDPTALAQQLMVEMSHLDHEHLRVVLLDSKRRIITQRTVYIGTLDTTAIRVGELFKDAVRLNAAAIILVHCHPSGAPEPSPEDRMISQQALQTGKLLDVECLDHIIIGQGRWLSMRQQRMIFS